MRRSWTGAVALLLIGAPAAADPPPRASPITAIVTEAAGRTGIPEAWIWSVMRVESGGELHAVSRAGAMGLMQIMPATWSDLRSELGLGDDPFDPHDNILAGATYLRALHDRYGEPGFLAAYNAGPARYDDYLLRHRPLPLETTAYVNRLASAMGSGVLPDPHAWARATLFVGAAKAGLAAANATAEVPIGSGPAAEAAPQQSLFVRVSAAVHP